MSSNSKSNSNFCSRCGRHSEEVKLPIKKSGDSAIEGFICLVCIGEDVANMTSDDIDNLSVEAYNNLTYLVMDDILPEPIRRALFNKVLGTKRLAKTMKKMGLEFEYDTVNERVRIKK